MARWIPRSNEPVGKNEAIARRLFDEPMLVGAIGQRPYAGLDLRNFEETRADEFSVDRLGVSGVNKAVVRYILPLAEDAAKQFHSAKRFEGWATLPADRLVKPYKGIELAVIPSPEMDNPYHAHVSTGSVAGRRT